MWKKIRVAILLFILATVAHRTWLEGQDVNWDDSLYVAIYPINADGDSSSSNYVKKLEQDQFEEVEDYFAEEAARHGLALAKPFKLRLGEQVRNLPPPPPSQGGMLQVVLWSLKFRYWAWQNSPKVSVPPAIKLYLLYHNPKTSPALAHSTALSKGRVGMVNLFADKSYNAQNNVVLAHELLHTVGATDKYDLNTTLPAYPDGFAEPQKQPLYPQTFAELMGGRVPVSQAKAEIPKSLAFTLIGDLTAQEISWTKQ